MENNEINTEHSKELNLTGPTPDFSKYTIKKNAGIPSSRHGPNSWDHLINHLDKGDAIDMNKKEAHSLTNRARILGYVIVLRKIREDLFRVWFGGLKK